MLEDGSKTVGCARQAKKHQWRIQGNRRKGIDGDAIAITIFFFCTNRYNTSGKTPQDIPKSARIKRHQFARETPAFRPGRDSTAAQAAPIPASPFVCKAILAHTYPYPSARCTSEQKR